MHIDLRFSVLSFFLVWGALMLTVATSILFIRDRPRCHTIVLGVVALLLWTVGTLVPILT